MGLGIMSKLRFFRISFLVGRRVFFALSRDFSFTPQRNEVKHEEERDDARAPGDGRAACGRTVGRTAGDDGGPGQRNNVDRPGGGRRVARRPELGQRRANGGLHRPHRRGGRHDDRASGPAERHPAPSPRDRRRHTDHPPHGQRPLLRQGRGRKVRRGHLGGCRLRRPDDVPVRLLEPPAALRQGRRRHAGPRRRHDEPQLRTGELEVRRRRHRRRHAPHPLQGKFRRLRPGEARHPAHRSRGDAGRPDTQLAGELGPPRRGRGRPGKPQRQAGPHRRPQRRRRRLERQRTHLFAAGRPLPLHGADLRRQPDPAPAPHARSVQQLHGQGGLHRRTRSLHRGPGGARGHERRRHPRRGGGLPAGAPVRARLSGGDGLRREEDHLSRRPGALPGGCRGEARHRAGRHPRDRHRPRAADLRRRHVRPCLGNAVHNEHAPCEHGRARRHGGGHDASARGRARRRCGRRRRRARNPARRRRDARREQRRAVRPAARRGERHRQLPLRLGRAGRQHAHIRRPLPHEWHARRRASVPAVRRQRRHLHERHLQPERGDGRGPHGTRRLPPRQRRRNVRRCPVCLPPDGRPHRDGEAAERVPRRRVAVHAQRDLLPHERRRGRILHARQLRARPRRRPQRNRLHEAAPGPYELPVPPPLVRRQQLPDQDRRRRRAGRRQPQYRDGRGSVRTPRLPRLSVAERRHAARRRRHLLPL